MAAARPGSPPVAAARLTDGAPAVRFVRAFAGASLLCPRPVLRIAVRLAGAADRLTAARAARLRDALAACRPDAPPPAPRPAPAAAGADDTVQAAALIGEIAVTLQGWIGHPVSFFAAPPARDPGWRPVVFEYRVLDIGLRAGQTAAAILQAALAAGEPPGDAAGAVKAALDAFFREHAAAPGFIAEAEARGIPWRQPIAGWPFYDLGQGCKQRRLWRHFTPATSHIATIIATNKHVASALFRANAIPAPRGALAADAEEAVRTAHAIGLPVVVKPAAADFGTAVAVRLSSDAAIREAFAVAGRHGAVLVEEFIPGCNHRLLVMYGRLVSVVRQTPAQVAGDGASSVRALVERTNRTRSTGLAENWKRIALDAETDRVLRDQGLGLDAVPPAGAVVRLRYQSNLSVGGTMENVTAVVHPDNRHLAERAAAVAGLDIAGIDLITGDIARSWREVGGAICEINPTPGFIMGEPAGRIDAAFLDGLFAPGDDGRLPTVALLDGDPSDRLLAALERLLSRRGGPVGVAARGTARVGPHLVAGDGARAARRAALLLADPAAGAALLATTTEEIAERGLGFDRCTAALLLGAGADRPERQAAARLLASVADAVIVAAGDGVLPALAAAGTALHVIDAAVPMAGRATLPATATVWRAEATAGGLAVSMSGPQGASHRIALPAVALQDDAAARADLLRAAAAARILGLDEAALREALPAPA